MRRRRIEVPSTIGGLFGAGLSAVVTALSEAVAKAHGFDFGPAIDATVVFTMMGSGGALGDHLQRRIAIRKQLSRVKRRVRRLEDGRARTYLLERLRCCEADWRAGLLSDDGIRDFVLDEVYARYVVPHDAARARSSAAAQPKATERTI